MEVKVKLTYDELFEAIFLYAKTKHPELKDYDLKAKIFGDKYGVHGAHVTGKK